MEITRQEPRNDINLKPYGVYTNKPQWNFVKNFEDTNKNVLWNYVAGYVTNVNNYLRAGIDCTEVTSLIDPLFKNFGEIDVYRTVDKDFLINLYSSIKEGQVLEDLAYMSTSKKFKSPWSNTWLKDDVIIHITGKSYFIDINQLFQKEQIDCSEQEEILLPRKTKLKVLSISRLNNIFSCYENYFIESLIV